jgi:hypothetical protein
MKKPEYQHLCLVLIDAKSGTESSLMYAKFTIMFIFCNGKGYNLGRQA